MSGLSARSRSKTNSMSKKRSLHRKKYLSFHPASSATERKVVFVVCVSLERKKKKVFQAEHLIHNSGKSIGRRGGLSVKRVPEKGRR